MRKTKRNRIIFGYLLILLGIILPLYGFTGLAKSITKDKKGYESFLEKDMNPELREVELEKIKNYNDKLKDKATTIVDPFATDEFKTKYGISDDPDMIFAYLRIPAIDLLQPIRLDASHQHMADGVAHIDGTALPVGGLSQRSVIAGHRGYYQSIMFLYLDDLVSGDKVYIDRGDEVLEYEVVDKEIINPSEWEKLNPEEGRDLLTLLTCDPLIPPSPHRLLVHCERIVQKTLVDSTENDLPEENIERELEEPTSNNIKIMISKYIILAVTIILWIMLIFTISRLISYIRNF